MSESRNGGESRYSSSSYNSYSSFSSESRGTESRTPTYSAPKYERITPKVTSNSLDKNKIVNPVINKNKSTDIGVMRSQIIDELYQEFFTEIKDEVRQEMQDTKGEIVREVAEELKTKLKTDLRKQLIEGKNIGENEDGR